MRKFIILILLLTSLKLSAQTERTLTPVNWKKIEAEAKDMTGENCRNDKNVGEHIGKARRNTQKIHIRVRFRIPALQSQGGSHGKLFS